MPINWITNLKKVNTAWHNIYFLAPWFVFVGNFFTPPYLFYAWAEEFLVKVYFIFSKIVAKYIFYSLGPCVIKYGYVNVIHQYLPTVFSIFKVVVKLSGFWMLSLFKLIHTIFKWFKIRIDLLIQVKQSVAGPNPTKKKQNFQKIFDNNSQCVVIKNLWE